MNKMPAFFFGHGSPMNIIEDNAYTRALKTIAAKYPVPSAILSISAHWETNGTMVTGMTHPKTIHDFGGFPNELYQITYPAPGSLELAQKVRELVKDIAVEIDLNQWGLDHGTWAVLTHLYPKAQIPVVQLSLDRKKSLRQHFELGKKLKKLREQGVLIIGSGNIVHNLFHIDWDSDAPPYEWCLKFDQWVKTQLVNRNFDALIDQALDSKEGRLSIPTLDHYLPLLYILGAADEADQLVFEFEGYQNASMSMRSFRLV